MTTTKNLPASLTACLAPATFLDAAEVAKLVRKALKEAFPTIVFSVRTSKYSGGASIDVSWVDGPTVAQVEPFARVFQGARFDGMTDSIRSHVQTLDGRNVTLGADFVRCHHRISDERINALVAILDSLPRERWDDLTTHSGHPFCTIADKFSRSRDVAYTLCRVRPIAALYDTPRSATAARVLMIDAA